MSVYSRAPSGGRVLAILGPTNTGKTHLAVERMLAHRTGVIGLPLRLLAREIYDRVVTQRGARSVALITGEERILPPNPSYFVCTVESMPLDRHPEFLAVDEIQLAADPERGHVFTDRLLRARGSLETVFLGAETIKPLLRRLLPDAEFVSRPRFSDLAYGGEKKMARLPRRTAIVAFSAAEVYVLAELIRRQRGGAAVVLGALSPRTRNAQVALYQSGEVDYLVATDAIGMGLNMDVDHVAFASLNKFDGRMQRALTAAEVGQIAGRAGRHMNNGSFGTTAGAGKLDPQIVEMVENHRFDPIRQLQWRSSALDFGGLDRLLRSLEARPPSEILVRHRDAPDHLTLRALAGDGEVRDWAASRSALRRLWEACQIPDFRKTSAELHHRLVRRIYAHLMSGREQLPQDWVAAQVSRLDRTDGDIDTLAGRIAHVRTWTYISNRANWLADAQHWQERTRAIEDKLSDALHAALTQRFVDRRTAALFRGLREKRDLFGAVTAQGEVLVEGQYVGRLRGLNFTADTAGLGGEARAVHSAANRVLSREIVSRAARLAQAPAEEISWREDNRLWWSAAPVARLLPGPDLLRPRVALLPAEHLTGPLREEVRQHLSRWVSDRVRQGLAPLFRLADAPFSGAARGLAYQLTESLGGMRRETGRPLLRALDGEDRRRLRRLGVRLGHEDLFLPALLRPERAALRARLSAAFHRLEAPPELPAAGRVSAPADPGVPDAVYEQSGFRRFGGTLLRVDIVDRLAAEARRAAARAPDGFAADHQMLSLAGCGRPQLTEILAGLGYRLERGGEEPRFRAKGRRGTPPNRRTARQSCKQQEASPFAALRQLGKS